MDHAFWTNLWQNLVHLGTVDSTVSPVTVTEKVIRAVVVYSVLLIGLRAFGRRVLAQLNPFDLVILLMLSNTVQNAIIGNDTSLVGGMIGVATLFATNAIALRLSYRGPRRALAAEAGGDVVLISEGRVNDALLSRLRMNHTEILLKAHERGFDSLDEVDRAVMSPDGNVYLHGKRSLPADSRLDEALRRLDGIQREVAALRK